MDNSIWKVVPSVPQYEVSSRGEVRHSRTKKVRKLIITPQGHRRITAQVGGKHTQLIVSRLVCEAFHGAPPEGLWALHKDGNPANNTPENLYWGDNSSNQLDSVRHGTHWEARKTHCKRGHPYTDENTYLRRNGRSGRNCRACARENYHLGKERRRLKSTTDTKIDFGKGGEHGQNGNLLREA